MRLPREEARREANKIKGVYSRFILVGRRRGSFYDSQEFSKVGAHGYVHTYPDSFYALTGMEWVWGICIGVGSALLFDCQGFMPRHLSEE